MAFRENNPPIAILLITEQNEAVSQARFAAMQACTLASEAAPASPEAGKLPSHEKFVATEDFPSASEAEKPPTQPIFVSVQVIFLAVQPIFVSVQAIFVSVQAIFLPYSRFFFQCRRFFLQGRRSSFGAGDFSSSPGPHASIAAKTEDDEPFRANRRLITGTIRTCVPPSR